MDPEKRLEALEYIASYEDLIAALGPDPDAGLAHYETHGADEGRSISFHSLAYIASYADLMFVFGVDEVGAARHFIKHAEAQGREVTFDPYAYLASYDDLLAGYGADVDAGARHYIMFGHDEGREHDTFDGLAYIAGYADLIDAFGADEAAAGRHFVAFGYHESRSRDAFDAEQYLANYVDLREAFGDSREDAIWHILHHGRAEGRTDDALEIATTDDGLTIAENSSEGTAVGTVSVNGKLDAVALQYAIVGGNDDGLFAIDAETGEITVAGMIDYETASTHLLQVEVTEALHGPARSATGHVTVEIADVPEGIVRLENTTISVGEKDGAVMVPILRAEDLSSTTTVSFTTTEADATAGEDYTAVSGEVTFEPGEERVFVQVDIADDDAFESTESFTFKLSNVEGGTLLAPRTVRIDILDDENPEAQENEPPLVSDYIVSQETVIGGLALPIAFAFAPQDDSVMYVAEKGGLIKVYDRETGAFQSTFIDLAGKTNNIQDRGLMDIELHPNFPEEPYLYAFYVVDPPDVQSKTGNAGPDGGGDRFSYLVRFEADPATGYTTAVPGSETILLGGAATTLADVSGGGAIDSTIDLSQPASDVDPETGEYVVDVLKVDSRSHAGGSLAFGPDGALYVSVGDGASFNLIDPRAASAQDLGSLAGKILRIDPMTGNGLADNPFVTEDTPLDSNQAKVFQLGLRNPFSMGFTEDGRLFISETGGGSWEEVNSGLPGANFGWPYYEGGDNGTLVETPGYKDLPDAQDFYDAVERGEIIVTPAYRAFSHVDSDPGFQIQAITGADDVLSGTQYPAEFEGDFIFTDVAQGEVFTIDTDDRREITYLFTADGGFAPVYFKQGPDGFAYFAELYQGRIARLDIEAPGDAEAALDGGDPVDFIG